MNSIVEYNSSLKEGEEKLNNNEFFQDLCVLMENEVFTKFLNKHMNNWLDIKCSVTYMYNIDGSTKEWFIIDSHSDVDEFTKVYSYNNSSLPDLFIE